MASDNSTLLVTNEMFAQAWKPLPGNLIVEDKMSSKIIEADDGEEPKPQFTLYTLTQSKTKKGEDIVIEHTFRDVGIGFEAQGRLRIWFSKDFKKEYDAKDTANHWIGDAGMTSADANPAAGFMNYRMRYFENFKRKKPNETSVPNITVKEDYRGLGLGGALGEHFMTFIRTHTRIKIIGTQCRSDESRKLFARLGFTEKLGFIAYEECSHLINLDTSKSEGEKKSNEKVKDNDPSPAES